MKFFLVFIMLLCNVTYAKSLPPMGKRIYIVEKEAMFSPVKIKREDKVEKRNGILRDVIPVGEAGDRRREEVEGFKVSEIRAIKGAKLDFNSLAIRGRLSSPRLRFDLQALEIGRADQGVQLSLSARLLQDNRKQEELARKTPSP